MSKIRLALKITSDTRKTNHWVKGTGNGKIAFAAKVFDEGSKYGIDNGRISKLDIRQDNKIIVNFNRGWDVEPQMPEHRAIYEAITAKLNCLAPAHNLETAGG